MCQLNEYLQHLQKASKDYRAITGTNGVPSSSLVELTQEHMRKIDALRVKIRLEEKKVEREMERQQVAIADRKMAELVRLVASSEEWGEVRQAEGLVQVALKGVMAGLEKVMKAADYVRLRTLKGVWMF
ncbi:hypothetical protein GH714_014196 [Hevea brasiliensis]|uniref:DOG1 domain-containing protein n=1 Tax=Hevea brasiliensis TaxID=3981 RepID=A0A6A6LSW6_HEVBR|nr:hypothetical protein GH714_014196 [Hevea brasiliensis]